MLCYSLHSRRPAWAVSRESGAPALAAALGPAFAHSWLRCTPAPLAELISRAHQDSPGTTTPPRLLLQDRQHAIAAGETRSSQPKEENRSRVPSLDHPQVHLSYQALLSRAACRSNGRVFILMLKAVCFTSCQGIDGRKASSGSPPAMGTSQASEGTEEVESPQEVPFCCTKVGTGGFGGCMGTCLISSARH